MNGMEPFEPVSSYPKFRDSHLGVSLLASALFGVGIGVPLARMYAAGEINLDLVIPVLYFTSIFLWVPLKFVGRSREARVRFGPAWMESFYTHTLSLRRELISDVLRLQAEDDRSICFELVDGREFWIRRKEGVSRQDWNEIRAELEYRVECYTAPPPLPSLFDRLLGRTNARSRPDTVS